MTNILDLKVDPYNHFKNILGEKFLIISLNDDNSVSCCIGSKIDTQGMAYLLKMLEMVVDSHIHQTIED